MKVAIGNDHAGTLFKSHIINYLKTKNIEVINFGTNDSNSVDYPDFVHPVVNEVIDNKVDFGILLCGTANGVAMTANKYKAIRAGICWNSNIASLVRQHNNSNILCIPARFIKKEEINNIIDAFINNDFEGGRHQKRIDKIIIS
jgi:ribose 5-phosphate isomerase B|tara:strand:+ start:111 stop:542 length:432 start_codon:yes stop_codon:yes gene_type:complete